MNELAKSIRVGTVNFFGIIVPGVLVITMLGLGFFWPAITLISDLVDIVIPWLELYQNFTWLILGVLIVFAYVFGYILRLSSPDELDRISACQVINAEMRKYHKDFAKQPRDPAAGPLRIRAAISEKIKDWRWFFAGPKHKETTKAKFYKLDGWPFHPEEPFDKYPYYHFQGYLSERGHTDLIKSIATWGFTPEQKEAKADINIDPTLRSKSIINLLKMEVRQYCPELTSLLESKEGHIRLMAGAWAAFRFAMPPTLLMALLTLGIGGIGLWRPLTIQLYRPLSLTGHAYLLLAVGGLSLWGVMWFSNRRIKKLFHYRRVSELFHIVQAAHLAHQKRQELKNQNSTPAPAP
ncbi:MAG TPA: hypothetical protein DEH22_07620 [Chloroflexi bacterium]|nr:hypothetical protein [Chloroflexota bacterium]